MKHWYVSPGGLGPCVFERSCGRPIHDPIHLGPYKVELPPRADIVAQCIDKWQARLGLADWEIKFNPDRVLDDNEAANMSRDRFRRLAEIGIALDCPDSQLEAGVLHELLHIVLGPVLDMAHSITGALGDQRTAPILMDQVHDLSERAIEQIVDAITGKRQRVWGNDKLVTFRADDYQPPVEAA